MVSKESRQLVRAKKHMKIRNRFSGTAERPRLAVFRSNNHMYAQIIDDTVGNTLVSASTLRKRSRQSWRRPITLMQQHILELLSQREQSKKVSKKLFSTVAVSFIRVK